MMGTSLCGFGSFKETGWLVTSFKVASQFFQKTEFKHKEEAPQNTEEYFPSNLCRLTFLFLAQASPGLFTLTEELPRTWA